jgi:hypothetical protein
MMVDPDGTVWLGGWTELQRLSPDACVARVLHELAARGVIDPLS